MAQVSEILTIAAAGTIHAAATTVTGTGVVFKQAWKTALVVLSVTAAATAVGDTFDVYIDTSPDGGTTWLNVGHFTQVLGNGGAKTFTMALSADNPGTSSVTNVTSDCAAGVTRQFGICDRLRYRSVVASASAPSFTFGIKAFLKA